MLDSPHFFICVCRSLYPDIALSDVRLEGVLLSSSNVNVNVWPSHEDVAPVVVAVHDLSLIGQRNCSLSWFPVMTWVRLGKSRPEAVQVQPAVTNIQEGQEEEEEERLRELNRVKLSNVKL